MLVPPEDAAFLDERGWTWEATPESGVVCLVLHDWALPPGYNVTAADLLVHLPGGYPDVPLDMWWFSPAVLRADGTPLPATESTGQYLGRTWQRWSRHFTTGQWHAGVDNLQTYLARLRADLVRSAQQAS